MDESKRRSLPEWVNVGTVIIALFMLLAVATFLKVWVVDPYNVSKSDWVLVWPSGGYECGDYDFWLRKSDGDTWLESTMGDLVLGNSSDGCMVHVHDYYTSHEFRAVSPGGVHVYDLRPSDRRLTSR